MADTRRDDPVPPNIKHSLNDVRRGLKVELERLDALLATAFQGSGTDIDVCKGKWQSDLAGVPLLAPEQPSGSPTSKWGMVKKPKFRALVEMPPPERPEAPQDVPPPQCKVASADGPPQCPAALVPISFSGGSPEAPIFRGSTLSVESPSLYESPPPSLGGSPRRLLAVPLDLQEAQAGSPAGSPPASARKGQADGSRSSLPPMIKLTPSDEPVCAVSTATHLTSDNSCGSPMKKLGQPPNLTSVSPQSSFRGKGSTTSNLSKRSWLASKILKKFQSEEAEHIARSEEMEKKKEAAIAQTPKKPEEVRWTMSFCRTVVRGQYFEVFMATAILLSSFTYGAEVQYSAHHLGESQPRVFFVMHLVFTVLFLAELGIRIGAEGFVRFACSKESRMWAWLDITVCSASVLETFFDVMLLVLAAQGDENLVGLGPLRIVRMTRILRISRAFRLQRFIRFVTSLRTLVYSIAVTLKSLFWAMVLLVMIMFVFAMCFTQFTVEYAQDPEMDPLTSLDMQTYWGTLDKSMVTLFQSIAGGISWREAALPMQNVSIVLSVLFLLYVSFIHFAVLNVITGVFCSSAIETAQRTPELVAQCLVENKKFYEAQLRKLFRSIDVNNTGYITLSEFKSLRDDEMTLAYFRALEIDFEDAWTIFKLIDEDKGGAVELHEFIHGCQQLRGVASSLHTADLSYEMRKLSSMVQKRLDAVESSIQAMKRPLPSSPVK